MIHADVEIHPTANVSPDAVVGAGTTVGPGAVIEAGARLGEACVVMANAVVTGAATLGARCRVHHGAVIGGDPQDLAFKDVPSRVVLGDDVVVREFATVHRATKEGAATIIGDGCYLMVNAHVAHDCELSRGVIVCNSALVAGHCVVGDKAFLSGNTVVHQFSRVGPLVMLSGISGVGRDVGPYLIVAGRSEIRGINVVGLRRAGLDGAARARVKEAYRELFAAATLDLGVARLRDGGLAAHKEIATIADFYSGPSKRGYSRPRRRADLESGDPDA
jgi:UDP-N-acetylglucosamine acyltransferase